MEPKEQKGKLSVHLIAFCPIRVAIEGRDDVDLQLHLPAVNFLVKEGDFFFEVIPRHILIPSTGMVIFPWIPKVTSSFQQILGIIRAV